MPVADQSTQVNFPLHTTTPRHRKHLHRHNTAGDILSMKMNGTVNNNALHHFHHSQTHCVTTMHSPGTKSLPHFKYPAGTPPTRPKSLSVLQPTPTISVTNGTTTPDASSTMSLASTPPSQRVPAVYENDTTTTPTAKDDNKKWNTAITTFNAGKVWKSNSSSGLRYDTGYDSPVSSPHRVSYNVGQECGCRCLCGGDQPRRKFTSGPSWLNNSTASLQDMGVQSPEGLSWRRLHMSRAKLKATATTSELLSGFAMIAMVELQINEPTEVPEWLFVMFSVCTTVLVAVHIFALMISTYLLPNIDAISKLEVAKLVTESPHERMRGFIELAWAFSTVFGLFLFLVEIAILCWVKFWDYSFAAAIAATVIVIPVLIIFVAFAVHFYHSLFIQRCESSLSDMEQLEDMKRNLDQVSSPV